MIKLNDEHHFYFNTENGRRYPSVTSSMLEMIKPKFNGDSIIDNILKSYQTFTKWYHSLPNKNNKEYMELVEMYYTYKKYRPFTWAVWEGQDYKRYKKIKSYKSKQELRKDLLQAKFESAKDIHFKKPKVYANSMFELKSKHAIKDLWKALTDIANVYGTMVHEICEVWFTERYSNEYYTIKMLNKHILNGWDELKEMTAKFIKEFQINSNFFKPYEINISLGEFSKHIQDSFLRLNPNLGINCISEKILWSRKHFLCGTTDTLIELDDIYFDIQDHKGLCENTDILCDTGWSKMKNLKVGDNVYDGEGNLTKITKVSETHFNPCYKLEFDTNDEIICDHEHRWVITKRNYKGEYFDVEMTTEDIENHYKKNNPKPLRIKNSNSSLKNKEIDLPIDPYVLGVWLGDGNRHNGSVTNINEDVWNEIKKRGYNISHDLNINNSKTESRTVYGLRPFLKKSNLYLNKHIPHIYFKSSYNQRLDLLRGFMDADGSFNRTRNRCVMNTTKKWQSDAIASLASSLGFKPTISNIDVKGFGLDKKGWCVCMTPNISPFLTRNKDYENIISTIDDKWKIQKKYRYIKSISKIDTVPTKCIAVDSPSKTYLVTKNLIKTHNTVTEFDFESEDKLLYPFHDYDFCDKVLYELQMSTYGRMHEMAHNDEKKCIGVWVAFFDRATNEFSKIDLEYKPLIADQLLEMHRIHIMKLVGKWKKSPHFSVVFQDVPKHFRMHLSTMLEKKYKEMTKVISDTELIKENLETFIKKDYLTWENV